MISKNFGQLLWDWSRNIKNDGPSGLYFCVTETHAADFQSKRIDEHVFCEMVKSGRFEMPPLEISISSAIAETHVLMMTHIQEGGLFPIGGFPRNLLKDYPGESGLIFLGNPFINCDPSLDTYRKRKRPQKRADRKSKTTDTLSDDDIRPHIENLLATSVWVSRFPAGKLGRIRIRREVSRVGVNCETELGASDSDSVLDPELGEGFQPSDDQAHQEGDAEL